MERGLYGPGGHADRRRPTITIRVIVASSPLRLFWGRSAEGLPSVGVTRSASSHRGGLDHCVDQAFQQSAGAGSQARARDSASGSYTPSYGAFSLCPSEMAQNRRTFLATIGAAALTAACEKSGPASAVSAATVDIKPRAMVGAIRFDNWSPNEGATNPLTPGSLAYQLLVSPGYPARWPYYVQNGSPPTMDESPQAIMDKDILSAVAAGIGFWIFQPSVAFDLYGLANYHASPNKSQLKYAMMMLKVYVPDTYATRLLTQINDAQYLTYQGRPVVFFFMPSVSVYSSPSEVSRLRADIIAAGHPNPYFIAMGLGDAATTYTSFYRAFGMDAASAYAGGITALASGANSYATLAAREEVEWKEYKAYNAPYVPCASLGFDARQNGGTQYTHEPTASEITSHVQACVDFVRTNPSICPMNMIVLSAWNEFVEGHFFAPQYQSGNADGDKWRLNAIAAALNA